MVLLSQSLTSLSFLIGTGGDADAPAAAVLRGDGRKLLLLEYSLSRSDEEDVLEYLDVLVIEEEVGSGDPVILERKDCRGAMRGGVADAALFSTTRSRLFECCFCTAVGVVPEDAWRRDCCCFLVLLLFTIILFAAVPGEADLSGFKEEVFERERTEVDAILT